MQVNEGLPSHAKIKKCGDDVGLIWQSGRCGAFSWKSCSKPAPQWSTPTADARAPRAGAADDATKRM
jgi:hypothetical protein